MTADELQIAITFSGIFGCMFIWAISCTSRFARKFRIATLVCRNYLEITYRLAVCVGALLKTTTQKQHYTHVTKLCNLNSQQQPRINWRGY
jgi:hypothetical protein